MKKIKQILALLISGIMALTPLTAFAAVETPTVTYTNSSNDSPDLYVTKITQDEYGNVIDAGDTEFEFTVKVNDSFYRDEEYRVFDSDGNEIYHYSDDDSAEEKTNRLNFTTDRNGDFTLKSGQTARFEWVGTGNSYEVYENTADGWTQIFPAGGDSATGTITATGNTVEFINIQSTGSSQLIVYKTTSFPDGYDAPETPEFTFNIYLRDSGNPAPYEYTLRDIDSGRSLGTTWTDSSGNFTLQGGQYAVFDVPQDVDYKVYEVTNSLEDTGWRVTSEESFEGTTGTGNSIVLDFNNAIASFAVSKKVTDTAGTGYDSDHDFTFLLTDADGYTWSGAAYYLYHTNGTPYYDENGGIQTGETDENGYFTLKENQTAIFYGIKAGTGYNVSEVKESGFTQAVPNNADGYTDKEVHDTTEVLPFTNSPVELTGNLVVTKTLDYTRDEDGSILTPEDNTDEFYFILYEEASEEDIEEAGNGIPNNWFNTGDDDRPVWWKPVEGAVYSVTIGNSTYTYKTGSGTDSGAQDRAGGFTLNANTSAVFSTLSVEKKYLVLEESWSGTYSFHSVTVKAGNETADNEENNDKTTDNEESNGESVRYGSATLTSDGITVDFVNTYNQELPTTPRLPSTGGRGVMPYVLFGATLAGCAVLMFYAKKKREIKINKNT